MVALVGVAAEIRAQRAAVPLIDLARRGGVNVAFAKWAAGGLSGRQIGGIAQDRQSAGLPGLASSSTRSDAPECRRS